MLFLPIIIIVNTFTREPPLPERKDECAPRKAGWRLFIEVDWKNFIKLVLPGFLGWLVWEPRHLNSTRTGWAAKQRVFEQPLLSLALWKAG